VLYSFQGGTDGANPNGGLILDKKGTIYGTTWSGGNQGCGTAWSTGCGTAFALLSSKNGESTEQVLHVFGMVSNDGANPAAGLVRGLNGVLYGTTEAGGASSFGAVFAMAPSLGNASSWTETVLYSFTDAEDGQSPMDALSAGSNGTLYGTTYQGLGTSQYGNVFRLTPPAKKKRRWKFDVLYGFGNHPPSNGAQLAAGLALDSKGRLYGTTQYGGTGQECGSGNCGVIFEISH
jgi:uncharacterized repeat protein (TIGR03803 family)